MTVLGRKVALTVPARLGRNEGRELVRARGLEVREGMEHPKLKGLSIHVYGVEGKDVTPASMVQKWLENVGRAKPRMLISATGRNKGLKGLDTELELDENGSITLLLAARDRGLERQGDRGPRRGEPARLREDRRRRRRRASDPRQRARSRPGRTAGGATPK